MKKQINNSCGNCCKYLRIAMGIIFLIISGHTLRGQVMSLKDNDLDRTRNLNIGGNIFGVDIYNPNLNFFLDGRLCYRIKNELGWIRAHYTIAWLDRIEAVTSDGSSFVGISANGTMPLRDIGGSIGFNFIKKEQFKVAKQSFMNTRKKDVKIPVKFLRLYGLHAGYEMFRTIVAQGSTTSYTAAVKGLPKDTTVTIDATPMLNMNIISFGIHRQWLENYVIHVSNNGGVTEYKSRSNTIIFADFLFGMNMLFDDILIPFNERGPNSDPNYSSGRYENYNYYAADINKHSKMIPVGARLGVEQISLGAVGFMMGAEVGFRPGIFDPFYNFYLLAKVGVSFNFKAK